MGDRGASFIRSRKDGKNSSLLRARNADKKRKDTCGSSEYNWMPRLPYVSAPSSNYVRRVQDGSFSFLIPHSASEVCPEEVLDLENRPPGS